MPFGPILMGSFGPAYVGSFSCASGSSASEPREVLDAAFASDAEDSEALSAATRRFAAASSCASVCVGWCGCWMCFEYGQIDRSVFAFHRRVDV